MLSTGGIKGSRRLKQKRPDNNASERKYRDSEYGAIPKAAKSTVGFISHRAN
jgi:hypothetical protein